MDNLMCFPIFQVELIPNLLGRLIVLGMEVEFMGVVRGIILFKLCYPWKWIALECEYKSSRLDRFCNQCGVRTQVMKESDKCS
jgi:hypothetical protein